MRYGSHSASAPWPTIAPFGGLVLCLTVAAVLGMWLVGRHSPPWRVTLPRLILPLSAALFIVAVFTGYYNWHVTGNAFLLPYTLNNQSYLTTRLFI